MSRKDATFTSRTHYIVDYAGGFRLYAIAPVQVQELVLGPNGAMHHRTVNYSELFGTDEPCLFEARDGGHGRWDVDALTGAQRWIGEVTRAEVRAALQKFGFDADRVLATYRKSNKP